MAQVVASLTALIGADTKGFEAGAKRVKGGMSDLARSIGSALPANIMQFASLAGAIAFVGTTIQDTLKKHIEYANSVRELATVGNTSTEAASRFIQVLDDYKISAGEATLASKALKENGMVPTIETLAKLSDAYLAIKDPAEKMKFVQDNLGRGGVKWVEVLNKGSAALLKQNDAVAKNLILTQKMVDDARKAEIAMDSWNDSVTALKTSFAVGLLPALTDFLNGVNDAVRGQEMAEEAGENWWRLTVTQREEFMALAAAEREQMTALMLSTGAVDENSQALSDNKEAVKAAESALEDYKDMLDQVSQANQDAESFIQSYADFQQGYAEDHADAIQDQIDAVQELADAEKEGGRDAVQAAQAVSIARRELADTIEKYGNSSVQAAKKRLALDKAIEKTGDTGKGVEAATKKLDEANKAITDLEATWHESTQGMIYDMILAKVSVDGLTNSEFKATQQLAVSMGIRTQAEADTANAMMDTAQAAADGIALQEDVMREKAATDADLLELENQRAIAAGETTGVVVSGAQQQEQAIAQLIARTDSATLSMIRYGEAAQRAMGMANGVRPTSTAAWQNGPQRPFTPIAGTRDSGGTSIAGTPYMIGTGAQPEMFIPNTNGTFIPNADKKIGGTTYNIVVNNPKKETAENSIRDALKNMSYLGAAA